MSKVSYYTAEGLKKLREELNHLKDVERPKASQAIAEARDKGDLSENAEYDAAKEAQGLLELQISKMEATLSNARLIDESQLDTSKVLVHSTVEVKNKSNAAKMKYKLVAQSEADLKTGKISVDSPIGKGLLGKKRRRNCTDQCAQWYHRVGNSLYQSRLRMAGIFSKIIAGEIPSYKVYEDENCYAFLDINPNALGHTLCVTKKEVNKIFDLSEKDYNLLMQFSRKVALAIGKAIPCKRVGMSVIGLEVPHVHVHLIPLQAMEDATFQKKVSLTPEEFKATAVKIQDCL